MASSKEDVDRPADSQSLPKNPYKDPDDGRQRFLLELEFVQCLANPTYIHYLAQNRYFEDEAFIGYLKYLQYWQRPEYIQFIMYPHCLFFLELLQNANFRNAMAHPGSKELAHRQQYYFWKNYRNNRLKHILPRPLPEPPSGPAPAPLPTAAPVPTSAPVPNAAPILTPVSAPLLAPIPPMSSGPVHSPMQFVGQPGSAISKSDMRNTMGDRRKRKYIFYSLHFLLIIFSILPVPSYVSFIPCSHSSPSILCFQLFVIVILKPIKSWACGV